MELQNSLKRILAETDKISQAAEKSSTTITQLQKRVQALEEEARTSREERGRALKEKELISKDWKDHLADLGERVRKELADEFRQLQEAKDQALKDAQFALRDLEDEKRNRREHVQKVMASLTAEWKGKYEAVKEKYEKEMNDVQTNAAKIAGLIKTNNRLTAENKALQRKFTTMKTERLLEVDRVGEKVAELEETTRSQEVEIRELKKELEETHNENVRLIERGEEIQSRSEWLEQHADEFGVLDEIKEERDDAVVQVADLEAENKALKKEVERLRDIEEAEKTYELRLAQLQNRIRDLEKKAVEDDDDREIKKPLVEMGVAIRRRFLDQGWNTIQDISDLSVREMVVIRAGNDAAHRPDGDADEAIIVSGNHDTVDERRFKLVYGIDVWKWSDQTITQKTRLNLEALIRLSIPHLDFFYDKIASKISRKKADKLVRRLKELDLQPGEHDDKANSLLRRLEKVAQKIVALDLRRRYKPTPIPFPMEEGPEYKALYDYEEFGWNYNDVKEYQRNWKQQNEEYAEDDDDDDEEDEEEDEEEEEEEDDRNVDSIYTSSEAGNDDVVEGYAEYMGSDLRQDFLSNKEYLLARGQCWNATKEAFVVNRGLGG